MFGIEQIVESLEGFANLGEMLFGERETTHPHSATSQPDITLGQQPAHISLNAPAALLGEEDSLPDHFIPPWYHPFSNS